MCIILLHPHNHSKYYIYYYYFHLTIEENEFEKVKKLVQDHVSSKRELQTQEVSVINNFFGMIEREKNISQRRQNCTSCDGGINRKRRVGHLGQRDSMNQSFVSEWLGQGFLKLFCARTPSAI